MKTKFIALAIAMMGTSAVADTIIVSGEVVSTNRVRSYMSESIPYQNCTSYDVTERNTTDNQAAGAVIGAIVGNQFGEGDGKTAMTILGAIVGADQGRKNSHTRVERHTETQCNIEWDTVRSHYRHGYETVIFDGDQYLTFHTDDRYRYGDTVSFRVEVQ